VRVTLQWPPNEPAGAYALDSFGSTLENQKHGVPNIEKHDTSQGLENASQTQILCLLHRTNGQVKITKAHLN